MTQPGPTVFDEIFALLTPDRLLQDPRATGEGVSVAVIDSGVERAILEEKFGRSGVGIHPIEGAVFRPGAEQPDPYDGPPVVAARHHRRRHHPHGRPAGEALLRRRVRPHGVVRGRVGHRRAAARHRRLEGQGRQPLARRAGTPAPAAAPPAAAAAGHRGGLLPRRAGVRGRAQRAPAHAQLPGRVRPAAHLGGQGPLRRPARVRLPAYATGSSFKPTAGATSARSPASPPRAGPRRTWRGSPPASCR